MKEQHSKLCSQKKKVLNKAPYGPAGTVLTWYVAAVKAAKGCKRMNANIFTSGGDATFLAEQMTADSKGCCVRGAVWIARTAGEHLGAVGTAEGRVEYIVTLMRLSDSSVMEWLCFCASKTNTFKCSCC